MDPITLNVNQSQIFLDSPRLGTETWDAIPVLACATVSIKPCELLRLLLSDTLNADRQLACGILP